jgi:sugar lactone lactonase YvrE
MGAGMPFDIVTQGLCFPEGPRWHDGRFWFSDMHDHAVYSVVPGQDRQLECVIDGKPSGLGWLPDGRMLIVSMVDQQLLRREADGALVVHADLSSFVPGRINDMVVDGLGRAYVGNFGFDMVAGEDMKSTHLVRVDPDGICTAVGGGLTFPNGTIVTPDHKTLVVAETFADVLSAYDIAEDGDLKNKRVWAQMPDKVRPDGMCLDAEGAIWVASPFTNECYRVAEGGVVLDVIASDRMVLACALGGDDRKTLYMCTSEVVNEDECLALKSARIETKFVDVPGTGYP